MRIPLAIGYILVALVCVSLLSLFWLVDLLPDSTRDLAIAASGGALFLGYVGLWLWMLFDHLFAESKELVALTSLVLIFGGGIAGIAYFFLVFRPRMLAHSAAGVSGVGV
jgi:hypothetical protein